MSQQAARIKKDKEDGEQTWQANDNDDDHEKEDQDQKDLQVYHLLTFLAAHRLIDNCTKGAEMCSCVLT